MFGDEDAWRNVSERERRDLFDDVVHLIAKREKVRDEKKIIIFFFLTVEVCFSWFGDS